MNKITSILIPTDFSEPAENAFQYALQFASDCGASIKIVHVVYPQIEGQDLPLLVSSSTVYLVEAAEEAMKAFVEAGIKQARETLGLQHSPVVQSQVVVGMPATMIAEIAKQDKTDLIIMGTRGEHGATDDLFGSQTTATLSRVHCPILVVPEGAKAGKITTVAYATDLDEATPFLIWETARFLEPVHTILRLVHVRTKTDEVSSVKMNDIQEFFADHAPSLQLTFHNISGKNVVQELNDFAKNWAVDLLVMHSSNRNFIERLFHKSTTRQEVLHGKVPLLVLKD